jgi:hypothetical protein
LKSRIGAPLAALLLLGFLAVSASRDFPWQFGYDFYHLWGIALAQSTPGAPRNPYADTDGYAQVLNAVSDASRSEKLHSANAFRRVIEPTGTPLFYASFAFLPADFDRAHALFAILQFLAFGASVFLLARMRGLGSWLSICIALAVALTFNPFLQDVKFGNVNSFQLLFVAILIQVAAKRLHKRHPVVDRLYLAALAVFLVFKPNTLWIAAALALHFAVVRGPRKFLAGTGIAALFSFAALAGGAAYFHGMSAWADWLRYTQGLNGGTLLYALDQGNRSLPMWLAERSMAYGAMGFSAIVAAVFTLSLVAAMTSAGKRSDLLAPAARRIFSDPWLAASIGVVFTFATSPLMWPHYHVFALIPIFWLVRRGRPDLGTGSAIATYVALSRPLMTFLLENRHIATLETVMLFAWIPLAAGIYSRVVELSRETAPAVPVDNAHAKST